MKITELHTSTKRSLFGLIGEGEARARTKAIYDLLKSNDAFYSLAKLEFTALVRGELPKKSNEVSEQQHSEISMMRDIVCMKMVAIEEATGTKFVDNEAFRERFLDVLHEQIDKLASSKVKKPKGGRDGI